MRRVCFPFCLRSYSIIFDSMDVNGDGSLTVQEMVRMDMRMGMCIDMCIDMHISHVYRRCV